ncbi:MAG: histidinol-phosphate transaminase [Dehalococcoidales bacterium]|nr:histidinol-phosphate transaminase [Dehalococcoidales bacterium]
MSGDGGIERLIRPGLVAFGGYSARKSSENLVGELEVPLESVIKLDANENPYGCSPRVNRALASYREINTYADAGQQELSRLIEGYTRISAGHIVSGNGSCELIDLLFRLFVEPGDEVIVTAPAFIMYRFSAGICGGRLVEVPRDKGFGINVAAIKAAIGKRTRMIIIDNPNNPTGNLAAEKDILEIAATGLPLVVDEAYFEFAGETVAPLMGRYHNLMVLRTFSKWAGLAGLRIGYGLFPPIVADYLMKIKLPYNVNVAAIVAVRESLKDLDYLMDNVRAIIAERERLFNELKKFKFLEPFPSRANFILCSVLGAMAGELCDKLQRRGIQVRYFNTPVLKNYIRISVGKPEHTDILIRALQKIGEETNG